jgi:hypothetical protein
MKRIPAQAEVALQLRGAQRDGLDCVVGPPSLGESSIEPAQPKDVITSASAHAPLPRRA